MEILNIDKAIAFCYEKAENIKLKAEPQVFIDIAKQLEELKQYKNLEERGLLLKLPCKIGDTLYRIDTYDKTNVEITSFTVESISICKDGDILFKYDNYDGIICELKNIITDEPYLDYYRIFLIEEEANQALLNMKEG